MAPYELVNKKFVIVWLLTTFGLKESSSDQSPDASIGFDLEQAQLKNIILLDSRRGNHDLIESAFDIPEGKIPESQKSVNNDIYNNNDINTEDVSKFQPPWDLKPLIIPSGGDEQCDEQVKLYLRDLKTWQEWAIQMWDATGKLNAGLFSGNGNQLGDFDSCLNINGPRGFKPNYCLAAIDLKVSNDAPSVVKEIVNKAQGESFLISSLNDPGHFIPRFSTLTWGICIPMSCSKESIEKGLMNALAPFNSTPGLTIYTGIPKYACHEETDYIPLSTIITVLFFTLILFVSIAATILDLLSTDTNCEVGTENCLVIAFSLKRGLKELFCESNDEFPCIHGIRAVCTILLYIAHKLMPLAAVLFSNRIVLTRFATTPMSSILRASNMYTDSFLFISGVLSSYNLTKEVEIKGHIKWQRRVITRLIRLTPALLAVVLYYAYVMEFTGSGPQWGTVVKANADLCKKGLWKNLLYIQNFFKFEEMCGPHTHQLALDTQMFILAPGIVYILETQPIIGFSLMVAIAGASTALRFYATYNYNLSSYIPHGARIQDLYRTANLSYGQTLHRVIPYLIGIGFGYLSHKYKKNIYINTKMAVLGWTLCLIGVLYSIFSQTPLGLKGHVYDPFDASLYAAISPFTWNASLCWIILMCSIHRGGMIERFLGSRYLLIISRLSFSFYLTQFIAFHYNTGSLRATEEARFMAALPLGELAIVFFLSLVLTLTFDLPMQEIKNIVLSGNYVRSKKPD